MKPLANAKKLLIERNAECVVLGSGTVLITYKSGITPIVKWLNKDKRFFNNSSVADKSIGLSKAYLFAFAGVGNVYADVMSAAAIKVFEEYGIRHEYEMQVPLIQTQLEESAALNDITSPEEAYARFAEMVGE